jgi:transposase
MRDTEVFGTLLGLTEDWSVSSVDLSLESQTIRVTVEHRGTARCPECGSLCPLHDHSKDRTWRHLDTMQFTTLVVCRVPRVRCTQHGVKQISVPWAEPDSRFTILFERLVISVLQATKAQRRCASLLKLNPWQVHDVMGRAVKRGLHRRSQHEVIQHLSIDEKSFQCRMHYVSVLSDLEGKKVIEVCDGRTTSEASLLLKKALTLKQRKKVVSVTMDMWEGFINAAQAVLPHADIVFDRFHVARYLNKAVDQTRISEHKRLTREGDDSLKGSKFAWVTREENLDSKQIEKYGKLLSSELETAKAWAFKETFQGFFRLPSQDWAEPFFEWWKDGADKLGNRYLSKVAKMLHRHLYGLKTYLKHKKSNSTADGINALIHEVKFAARGFRTFEGFRIAILFFLGKLDLYPRKSP